MLLTRSSIVPSITIDCSRAATENIMAYSQTCDYNHCPSAANDDLNLQNPRAVFHGHLQSPPPPAYNPLTGQSRTPTTYHATTVLTALRRKQQQQPHPLPQPSRFSSPVPSPRLCARTVPPIQPTVSFIQKSGKLHRPLPIARQTPPLHGVLSSIFRSRRRSSREDYLVVRRCPRGYDHVRTGRRGYQCQRVDAGG